MKSVIFGSETINQNVHEPNFLQNAKIFEERRHFRTGRIISTFFLQTINKKVGKAGLRFDFIRTF